MYQEHRSLSFFKKIFPHSSVFTFQINLAYINLVYQTVTHLYYYQNLILVKNIFGVFNLLEIDDVTSLKIE